MNKKNSLFLLSFMSFTITIEAKISIKNIKNRIGNVFYNGKYESSEQKEFKDVQKLELFCDQGNISIHTWKQPSTMIEIKKNGSENQHNQTNITFTQHEDVLQVQTNYKDKKSIATTNFNIIVSEKTDVKVATKQGNMYIKNLSGIVNAQTENGNIEVIDGSNTTNLYTNHGNIIIQRELMANDTTVEAESSSGSIILQVPQHINCNIETQAKQGKIQSDLLITIHPHTMKLNDETFKQQKHAITGSITKNNDDKTVGNIKLTSKLGSIKIKPYV